MKVKILFLVATMLVRTYGFEAQSQTRKSTVFKWPKTNKNISLGVMYGNICASDKLNKHAWGFNMQIYGFYFDCLMKPRNHNNDVAIDKWNETEALSYHFGYQIPIVEYVSNWFNLHGMTIIALDKMLYFTGGDLANGRAELMDSALGLVKENPLIGHGIAYFESRFNNGYVHNIFVQMMMEGGIILTLPFLFIIFMSFRMLIDEKIPKDVRLFLTFLISSCLFHLFFSETFWRLQYFWFYIGYSIKLYNHYYFVNKWHNSHTQLSSLKETL